jgi:hypothetical protein
VLLLEDPSALERVVLLAGYILLTLPLRPAWSFLFPKVWISLALVVMTGREYFGLIPPKVAVIAGAGIVLAAGISAQLSLASYRQQPGQRWERIAVEPGALYSSSPAVLRSGIVYNSISKLHYNLRWLHNGKIEDFTFDGEAFDPVAKSDDGPVEFELVAHRRSRMMLFNPVTKSLLAQSGSSERLRAPCPLSPNQRWIVCTELVGGSTQMFVRPAAGATATALTGGDCNSGSPAWELDSKGIIFASDCGRGIGLMSLYRARLDMH